MRNFKIIHFTLSDEAIRELDAIAQHYGIDSRSATIRFLTKKTFKEISLG